MYYVNAQGIDELMINVHYYYIHQRDSSNLSKNVSKNVSKNTYPSERKY